MDLAREQKKQWNMHVSVLPILGVTQGPILKGLDKKQEKMRNQKKNQDNQELLRSLRILRKVLETRGDLLFLQLLWNSTVRFWCEKLARSENRLIYQPVTWEPTNQQTNRQKKKQGKRNGKRNSCTNISSDKQAILLMRRSGHLLPQKRKWIFSNSNTKQLHKVQLYKSKHLQYEKE